MSVVRIVKLWITAPPFRLVRQFNNPGYLRVLEASRSSTWQWIGLVALGWAVVVSQEIARFGIYADERTSTGWALMIRALGSLTELAAVTLLLLFLIQWYMLNRVNRLRALGDEKEARQYPRVRNFVSFAQARDKPLFSTTY